MIIGLTGGSGTGKSTVSEWFLKKGFKIIDGDVISRSITKKGSPVLKKIGETFGEEFINHNGELNRKALGGLVFSDAEALNKLNEITHPAITDEVKKALQNTKNAVIEGAAIHECDIYKLCDLILFVSCPKEIQIERIMKRDNLSYDYAKKRVEAQKSDEEYRKLCDLELKNDGTDEIYKKLEDLNLV